jgi:hypothetical protein
MFARDAGGAATVASGLEALEQLESAQASANVTANEPLLLMTRISGVVGRCRE